MIDYELAEKIGATHIHRNGDFYKVSSLKWMNYNTDLRGWEKSMLIAAKVFDMLKPIPPKHTRTEYEKVTESIFDLRDELERGELYNKSLDGSGDFVVINSETVLFACASVGNVYHKVEKEIDERQEFIERAKELIDASKDADYSLGRMFDSGCRFVGANGEIE